MDNLEYPIRTAEKMARIEELVMCYDQARRRTKHQQHIREFLWAMERIHAETGRQRG